MIMLYIDCFLGVFLFKNILVIFKKLFFDVNKLK